MKFQNIFMTILSLCIPVAENIMMLSGSENINYGQWEMTKNSDGVQTYFRWIENTEGVRIRERKGEMVIECTVEDAVGIITNAKSTEHWMRNVKESFDITRVNSFEWFNYILFDIPWPFNDRDLVSRNTIKTNAEKDNVMISIISREDFIPFKSGINRLTDYTASWSIVSITNEKVRITFTAITNTPPMFPRWIQDPVLEHIFHKNLINLKAFIISHKKSGRN